MRSLDDRNEGELPSRPRQACVELSLLVPTWQWEALERAAHDQGLTIGQLLRRLIAAHVAAADDRRLRWQTYTGEEATDEACQACPPDGR
jgi:hypothetical protein